MCIDLTRDVELKDFFKNNERFTSIVNAILFHGKKVIFPNNVRELDSVESMITDKTIVSHKQDVIKLVWIDDRYVIIAMKNQRVP